MGFCRKRSSRTLRGGKHRSALAWFDREDYSKILETLGYPEDFSRDWNRWHELAQLREQRLKGRGFLAVRVLVRPDELLSWCNAKGIAPDVKALDHLVAVRGEGVGLPRTDGPRDRQ